MNPFVPKGRGAGSNPSGRFESHSVENDKEAQLEAAKSAAHEERPMDTLTEIELPNPLTIFLKDSTKTVLSKSESPDLGPMISINAYRGCEHGCIYCYARPTHEYLGMSAGLDFESKILVKEDAPELLRKEFLRPGYEPRTITISGNTDCYQPAERKFGLTRKLLEVMREFRHPVAIITKNHLVTRDIDILSDLASDRAVRVFVSITSLDDKLIGHMEPRTSRPQARLEAIRKLSAAGVPVGVMVAPVIPGLTDHEMPSILRAAAEAGATSAGYVVVRLPHGVAPLFSDWLGNHFPEKKEKVLHRIREIRGGNLYDSRFGSRMRGEGEYAELLASVFRQYSRKFGLGQGETGQTLNKSAFRRPGEQLKLGF